MKKKVFIVVAAALAFIVLTGCSGSPKRPDDKGEITISAAASLKDPMEEIAKSFEEKYGIKVTFNFASSGVLRNQIAEGATVDLFISASTKYVDELDSKGLVDRDTKTELFSNSLVLVRSGDYEKIKSLEDIARGKIKIAIGETSTVPVGQYARESLEKLGLWDKIQDRIIYAKDEKQVLQYVESRQVEAGIIYNNETVNLKNCKVVELIPDDTHRAIVYSSAVVSKSSNKDAAKQFVNFIKKEKGILEKYKFKVK